LTPGPQGLARAVVVLVSVAALGGCVTPATGAGTYRAKARSSVQAAISETETARITLQGLERGRIFDPTADVIVTGNETALGSIAATFGSVQPPAGNDRIRDETARLLSDAEDAVAAARIAVRRSDRAGIQDALTDVRKVTKQLENAERALS
jgi:hypothetical protein